MVGLLVLEWDDIVSREGVAYILLERDSTHGMGETGGQSGERGGRLDAMRVMIGEG